MVRVNKNSFILVLLLASSFMCQAQKSFMDISLTGGYSLVPEFKSQRFAGTVVSVAVNIHLTENISIGPFFSTGKNMEYIRYVSYDPDDIESSGEDFESDGQQTLMGLNARLSTNRNRTLRPYLNLSLFQLKLDIEGEPYGFDKKATKLGVGLGLMIKATRNLYVNLFDVNAIPISDIKEFSITGKYIVLMQTGISYNFGKSK